MTVIVQPSDVIDDTALTHGSHEHYRASARHLDSVRREIDRHELALARTHHMLAQTSSLSVAKVSERIELGLQVHARRISSELNTLSDALYVHSDATQHNQQRATNIAARVLNECETINDSRRELGDLCSSMSISPSSTLPIRWQVTPPGWHEISNLQRHEIVHPASLLLQDPLHAVRWQFHVDRWAHSIRALERLRAEWLATLEERTALEGALRDVLRGLSMGSAVVAAAVVTRSAVTRVFTGSSVHPWRTRESLSAVTNEHHLIDPRRQDLVLHINSLTDAQVRALQTSDLVLISNTHGATVAVRDIATRTLLDRASVRSQEVMNSLHITSSDMSVATFRQQISGIQAAVELADQTSDSLRASSIAQVFGLSSHDGQLVAAVSVGDVDHAQSVTINVPGMGSQASGMTNAIVAAGELIRANEKSSRSSDMAVVSWFGYDSPNEIEVLSSERAHAGALRLSREIDGISTMRQASAEPIENFSVLAHSYGSTLAVEAVQSVDTHIDNLVLYGSAGVDPFTSAELANVGQVHATDAHRDVVAEFGRLLSFRTDPRALPNVSGFTSEAHDHFAAVTTHDMYVAGDEAKGYLSNNTSSLAHIAHIIHPQKEHL